MKLQISLFAVLVILISGYPIILCTGLSRDTRVSCFGTISYDNIHITTFGVQVWWHDNLTYQMEKVAVLGVGWVRIHAYWRTVEPQQGQYNFDGLDTMVNEAKSHEIEPLLTAEGTPDWANGGKGAGVPPTDMAYFKNFAKTLVNRYDLGIIELANEPHYQFSGTDQQYVDFIHAGYDGAKEADPNCIVIAGYATGEIMHIYDVGIKCALDSLVSKGFLNYIDGLVIHPYTWTTPPEDKIPSEVEYLRNYLASKGAENLPLYNTEFGYSLVRHSKQEQADWTVRAAEICYNLGLKVNIYYCFWGSYPSEALDMVDPGYPDPDLSNPRPVYYAYQEFIKSKT